MNAKLISDGQPWNTRVVLENGSELQGLTRATFDVSVDRATLTAEIALPHGEVEGALKVYAAHPVNGDLCEVTSITFADGTEWSAS